MKIGIPRALLYYYYSPFWKTFFEELGIEMVISPKTSKAILDKGIKESVPEICVPIKIFNGHVVTLLEKDVDYVLIPRMVSIKKGEFFCPKFMGLPDIVRHSIPNAEDKILYPQIKTNSDNLAKATDILQLAEPLGLSYSELKSALKKAGKEWARFNKICKKGYLIPEANKLMQEKLVKAAPRSGDITIGLLGYVYNVYDEFVSMNVYKRLQDLNVNLVTFEMIRNKDINKYLKKMPKRLFWTFSNKLMGAGHYLNNNPGIDGIIHLSAFVCGPDSMLGQVLESETQKTKKPFMTVRVDEHTGENHLITRIEAFADMIRNSKKKRRWA
ncbi:MAG: hypothetical protein PWQ96_1065 [Clostridia bacterium]|jgi:predicted nucleotide-binding protein (sugar kinase/HSP70/actin superfamily)|nr:hypothetical protein [Clostridiales bacterium]MDK2985423.1 hypothetical protein [Clostridia bacterium]